MNNIELIKEYDPGTGRTRPVGSKMRVDPATKKKLIADGIAKPYTAGVKIEKKETAKEPPQKVTKPAKAFSQTQNK